MANDMRRAALAVLCVLAVVLGAGLFPATGFGANPVPDSGAASGGTDPGDDAGGPDDTATTTAADGDGAGTGTETATTTAADGGDAGSGTETATTTTTKRPTTTAPAGSDAAGEGGQTGSLLGLATMLLVALLGFLAVTVGLGRHHRRRNPEQWDLPDAPHLRLVAYVRRVPQTSLSFVMFAGANAPGIVDGLADGLGNVTRNAASAASGLGVALSTLGSASLRVPAGVLAGVGGFARALSSLTLSLPSLSTTGAGGLFGRGGDGRPGSDPRSGGRANPPSGGEPEPPEPPASVREAWGRLQEDLGVADADPRTPGEVARGAISRGLPADAVRSLTRSFREVRYGGRPDDGERVSTAREAYERIRSALRGDSA